MTPLESVTYPDSTGDFVLESVEGRWRITHHNVEDDEPTVFEWDSVMSAMNFLDECGVSRNGLGD